MDMTSWVSPDPTSLAACIAAPAFSSGDILALALALSKASCSTIRWLMALLAWVGTERS
jgi:hypothetical protein